MLANVTEIVLFPSQNYLLENFSSTSSDHQARASPKPLRENNYTGTRGKKHRENNKMMDENESENARHWFCNILSTADDRACATAVKDAAFTQLYLSLSKNKLLSQQVGSNASDVIVESSITNDVMPSFMKLDKKILNSNYTKSELALLYENHRQALPSADRNCNSKQPKSSKSLQSVTHKSRKKQGRVSSSEPSVCSATLSSVDSNKSMDVEGSSADFIEQDIGTKQEGIISTNDIAHNGAAGTPATRVEENSTTDINIGAAETIKTIVDHEIACGGASLLHPSSLPQENSNDTTDLSNCKSTSGCEKEDASYNIFLQKREVAAAKKMASRAICRDAHTKSPQSVVSIPNKNKKQTGIQSEKSVPIDINNSPSVSDSDLSILNTLSELHHHTRLAMFTHDTPSSSNNNCDYFDSFLLDSSFLAKDNGARFLQLADSLVQQHTSCKEGFLSTAPLKRSREIIKTGLPKMAYFPAWLKSSTYCMRTSFNHRREHEEDASKPILIPFYLLLLARIEIAIWGAYYRYTSPMKQNQMKLNCRADGLATNSKSRCVENAKISNNIYNIDAISRTLQKASKLHLIGEKIGLEKRQHIMNPIVSLLKRSKLQCIMHNGENVEIEVSNVDDDCLLENVMIVPWTWIMKSYQQKNNNTNESEDKAFYQIFHKVYQGINSSFADELKDEAMVMHRTNAENELEDIALSLGVETTSSKNKKKKKKKKQKKKTTLVNTNQITHVKPVRKAPAEIILDVDSPKQSVPSTKKNLIESDSSPKVAEGDSIKDINAKKNSAATTLQRVDGTGTACVVVEQKNDTLAPTDERYTPSVESQWERVESKCRGSRNKNGKVSGNDEAINIPKTNRNKSARTPQTRRRATNRKLAREIIFSILDDACAQAEIKRKQQLIKPALIDTKPNSNERNSRTPSTLMKERKLGVSSMRDIVMANLNSSSNGFSHEIKRKQQVKQVEPISPYKKTLKEENKFHNDKFKDGRKDARYVHDGNNSAQSYLSRIASSSSSKYNVNGTDQNTAPTLPETLSGVSGATISNNIESEVLVGSNDDGIESGNNSSDAIDLTKKDASDSPPLLTLLPGPQNVNSAASSVASSLEAIHTPSGQDQPLTEKDVGYHLLNVCDKLSNDMSKFMSRRSLALTTRRRERGVLLSSLQETVTKIWSGRSHVEMYGSCATQLDLPSSDLDLVICGLSLPNKNPRKGRKPPNDFNYDHTAADPNNGINQHSINAGRIMRLASELERQPFAVQVKAIPTASVPVLKMLADASRILTGNAAETSSDNDEWASSSGTGDWMGPAPIQPSSKDVSQMYNVSSQGSIVNPYPTPWRGADVMNGLLKVDITFEGPEHGGIGSTAYAAKVIQESCKETGLPPEATPVAQLIMALKELLAQRRLNEPFSGGLSSYALVLMVVAIVRERKAIKAEMELAERQRRAVASASATNQRNYIQNKSTAAESVSKKPATLKNTISAAPSITKKDTGPSTDSNNSSQIGVKVSSWASVAKKGKPTRVKTDNKSNSNINAKLSPMPDGATEKSDKSKQSLTRLQHQSSNCTSDNQANISGSNKQSTANISPDSQGSNDVLEVLCSGEPTAGKLLMHFLLFYGKLFDSMTMAIDVTAPDNGKGPFIHRQAGGTIDPFTGMLTVDPIVVFDPLEGAESNNVARSCFAWQSIKWVFGQCFSTLTHTMERRSRGNTSDDSSEVSPLLELILSY